MTGESGNSQVVRITTNNYYYELDMPISKPSVSTFDNETYRDNYITVLITADGDRTKCRQLYAGTVATLQVTSHTRCRKVNSQLYSRQSEWNQSA